MVKEIIITGSPRTGTSALCSLLYHSAGVMIANELSAYHRNKKALSDALSVPNPHLERALRLKDWSIEDLTNYLSGDFEDKNIKLFGDKNPDYCCNTFLPQYLSESYPNFKYIFCYRNPCATVASFLMRSKKENNPNAAWYAETAEEALDVLIKYTLNWATLLHPNVENKKIIIYEDHCEDVSNLIQELNEFLGITLDIHKPERLYYPVNIDTWKRYLSPVDIEMIKRKFKPIDKLVRSLAQDES